MKTTCLINSYNYAEYIGEAIESALAQTRPFDEIVIVDDASTDGTPEMLRNRFGRRAEIRLVEKERNEGQLAAFNEGFLASRGDVIFFLDADDAYLPGYVEDVLPLYLERSDLDFVFTAHRLFGSEDREERAFPEDRDLGYSAAYNAHRRRWVGGPTSTLSMRRSLLQKILPFSFVEDWRIRADDCLVFGAAVAGGRKYFRARPLVRYRVHGENRFYGRPEARRGYRRRLSIDSFVGITLQRLGHDRDSLARLAAAEFETLERPTRSELRRYIRISWGSRAPLGSRLRDARHMLRHYRTQRVTHRGATPARDRAATALDRTADREVVKSKAE